MYLTYYEAYEKFSDCNVLLHHEPPKGLSIARQKGVDYGSRSLFRAISDKTINPTWILCGHVHQPEKNAVRTKGTNISNPGSTNRKTPNYHIITINLNRTPNEKVVFRNLCHFSMIYKTGMTHEQRLRSRASN